MPDQDKPYIVSKSIDFLKKVAKANGIDEGMAESYLQRSNGNYTDAMDVMLEENGFNPYDDNIKKQIHEKEQLPILSSDYIFKNRLTDEEQKKLEQQSNTLFEKISKGRGIEERVGNFGGGVVLEERKYDDKDKARFKAELNEINDRLRRDDELRTLLPKVIKPEESILGRKGYRRLKQEASKEVSFEPGIGLGRRDYDPNTQSLLLKEQEAEKARRVAEEKKELDKEYLADPVAISANTAAVTAKAMGNDPVSALYASNKIMDDNAAKLLRQQAMAAEKYKAEPTEENAARLDEINLHIDAQAKEIAKGDRIGKALQVYSQKKAIEAELKAEEQGFVGDALTYSKNVALGVRDRIANGLDDIFSSRNDSFDEHQAKRAERGIAEADRIQQSALRGGLRERYVEVDGQKLVVDDIGDVMYGVDDKFRPTDKDLSSFINKYEANPESYEQKTDYSLSRLMGTSIQVMADMVPIIVANGGIAAATAALPGGQAKALRTVGSIFTSGVSMFSDNLKKNLELGKGFNYAWNTAMGTTLVQALIEQAGGFEARAGGALGDAAKKALTSKLDNLISSYAGKSLAKTDLVKKAQDILKDYIGEGAEETMQSITGHASDYLFYGEDMNVDWNEEFNTWASLPLSIGGIKAITGAMQNRSDKLMMRRGYNAALSNPAGHNEILDGLISEKKISEKEARIKKDVLAKSKPDYDAINSDAYDHISEKDKARLVSLMADRDMNRMMADYIEVGTGKATYTKKAEDLDKKFQELWKELDEKGINDGKRGHGDVRGINFFDNVNQEENEKYERQETGGTDGNSQGTADGERQGSQEKSETATEGTDRRDFGGATEGTVSILNKEAEDLLADESKVPVFVSKNLERIANENGITVTGSMTSADIINALREKKNGKPSDKSEGVQGNEAPTDGEGRSTAGEQGATAKDQGRAEQAPVQEAVPTRKQVPVLAEVTRKVRLREKLTEEEERVRPLAELWERAEKLNDSISDTKFRDSRDPSASYIDSNGNEGVIKVDEGGKAEFVYNGGVLELGNVSGGITAAMREAGISEQGKIIPQGNNKYSIDGVYYENRLSKPEAAISYDEKGNISVELDTVQGGYNNTAPVTASNKFTGPQAEELAYQIHLEKISKDEKGFIEYLRRRDDGRLPKASEETTNRNNEGVRAAEEKQEAGGERLTEREIQEKRLAKKSDIERRRQEEFDNVASQRVIKVEDYESTNDEGETTYIQVRHYANGSRKIFFNIEKNKYGNTNDNSPNSIAKEQSTEDALKYNFDESTFGKPKKVGERTAKEASLDSHDRKINAKYDAELAALEQSKDDFIEKRLEELTVSGLTEEERQREIAIRAKLTKMSPYEKGMNELWALVDRYIEMPNGARGKNTANGQTLWSSILTKAKELGIQATRSQNNVYLNKKNKEGELKRVAKSKNYKEYNYKALSPNEDKALLSRRSKSVKEIFLKLYYGLESSSVKIEYGVQLSDKQKEVSFDDVANGIPSNGAEAILDVIEGFAKNEEVILSDESLGDISVPLNIFLANDTVSEMTVEAQSEESVPEKEEGSSAEEEAPFQSGGNFEEVDPVLFKNLLKNLNRAIPGILGGVFSGKEFAAKVKEETGINMYDKKGTVYGFVGLDGKVYLNGDKINANSPIHEYGHVWLNIIKNKFPEVYKRGLQLADKSPYLGILLRQGEKRGDYATLVRMYNNGDKQSLQEEALAMAIGDRGERMVQSSMFKDFNGWVEKMWAAIKRLFGGNLTEMTSEQLNRLTFKQFSSLVAGQLVAGEAVGERVEMREQVGVGLPLFQVGKEWSIENKKHEVGNLSLKEIKELIKEIKDNFNKPGEVKWGRDNKDIRTNVFNTIAQKQVGSVVYTIGEGLIRDGKKTYLLYKNKSLTEDTPNDVENIIGEYKSLAEAKDVVNNIRTIEIVPQFQIVGERGIKNVADAAERLDKLAIAKEMEKAGKDFRAIFHATGWQKGGDKKWRTEISDVSFNELFEGDNPIAMRIEDNGGVGLGELVSGEVLNLYPDLKDVFVKFIKGTAGNGRFDGKEIQLQYNNDMDFITNEKVLLKALVHEIQHYVQKQEGFATGTTSDAFTDDKLNYMTQLVYEDFLMRKLGYDDYIKEQGNAVRSLLEPIEEWEGFKNNAKKGEAHIKKLIVEAKQYSVTKYRKVAGEAEANNVMNRLDMPLSERISKTFTDTEDVAEDEKIYLFNPDAQEATVEQQPIPNKGNSKELALAQAKESLKAAWDNLKSAGVVSDPYENAKKMKALIDSAIELVIAAGAKTKSEIMAALEGYVKITEAQINTIYKAVQGFNSPLSKDIMNDILLGTDSHESLRLLGIMRRNMTIVKDPVRYGQVLALEDAITKRIIEFEETQQAPDVTGRLDIISSFQKALSGYKIPSTVIKDVDITGAYEGLVDTVVEGTTMDDAIFHASTFLRNWYYKATQEEYRTNADGTMTRIQKISTKSFFELLAGYLNDSQTTGAGMISNAAFRLLAELKSEGIRSATYWNGIYDILNVEGQAQMRSNVAIVLASGTKDFSANAFGSEMEKIGKLKSDIDGNLTDEELDEENHSYLKSVGADMRSEEVSRKPTPLNSRIRARAKKIRKDVDESIYETVRDAIKKGCK